MRRLDTLLIIFSSHEDITLSLPSVAKPVFLTYNKIVKKWQSYFFFEGANTKYVRRSLSLYKGRYGPDFKYTEAIQHKWLISAILANLATVGVILLLLLPPVRWLVEKILPAGAGPTSPEALEKGMLRASFIGISEGEVLTNIKGAFQISSINSPSLSSFIRHPRSQSPPLTAIRIQVMHSRRICLLNQPCV